MPTQQEILQDLDRDEFDYDALARKHGPAALPALRAIVAADHPRLAGRAAHLAALIDPTDAQDVVGLATRSPQPIVRVGAAGAVAKMAVPQASALAERLAVDHDSGVRFRTVKSAMVLGDRALAMKLRTAVHQFGDGQLSALAETALRLSRG